MEENQFVAYLRAFKSIPYIEDISPTIGSLQDSSAGY